MLANTAVTALIASSLGSTLLPPGLAAPSACPPANARTLFTFNDKYAHVLANLVAHIHHQDCAPQTSIYCTGNLSLSLCGSLVRPSDGIECVQYDCPGCDSDDKIVQREAMAFLKFLVLHQALGEMHPDEGGWVMYLDGTALVSGGVCYTELASGHADVAISPEQVSFESGNVCPWPPLVLSASSEGSNANAGLLFFRNTAGARGLLDALVGDFATNGDDYVHSTPMSSLRHVPPAYRRHLLSMEGTNYTACPEQAWLNGRLTANLTRTVQLPGSSAADLSVESPRGTATVRLLDYRRWPRNLVPDIRAYAHWPRAVRERIGVALRTRLSQDDDDVPHHREQVKGSAGDRTVLPACLYHPHVPPSPKGTKHAQVTHRDATAGERGSQADFFATDGFWYL